MRGFQPSYRVDGRHAKSYVASMQRRFRQCYETLVVAMVGPTCLSKFTMFLRVVYSRQHRGSQQVEGGYLPLKLRKRLSPNGLQMFIDGGC